MSLNTKSMSLVGAAMTLVFAGESVLAQAKSQKRIPITKEAPGEVVRVDTVMRVDTLMVTNTIYRTDTLTRTHVRVDTVQLLPPVVPVRLPAGLYLGVAAGSSAPDGSIFIPNSVGYMGQLQLGWQNAKQFLGGRISGGYTGLGQDSRFSQNTNAALWTLSTDLKLNVPLGHTFGRTPKFAAYGIGGWTYTWYKDMPFRADTRDNIAVVFVPGNQSWTGRNGWDAGGGLSLMWGRSEVFVESRVLGFTTETNFATLTNTNINGIYNNVNITTLQNSSNSAHARQIPIVFGFNWY